jgi:hypothetical protein
MEVPQDRVVLRGRGSITNLDRRDHSRLMEIPAEDILIYSNGLILYRVGSTWRTGRVPTTEATVGDVEYVEAMMYDAPEEPSACEKCAGDPRTLPLGRCPKCGARA